METNWDKLCYPRLCALAGKNPTKLSQAMHNAAYDALGVPFTYVAMNTENTVSVLSAMRELGLRGLSLTIPHKERAVELVDSCSDEARRIGAINTVINNGSTLTGCNTDCHGIEAAFKEAGVSLPGKNALILGAGGAARAAAWVFSQAGMKQVVVSGRTAKRAEDLAADFAIESTPWEDCVKLINAGSELIIVNATPIGSHLDAGKAPFPFELASVNKNICVLDMATKRSTELIEACSKAGGTAISGLRMLLHQAVRQVELFTERPGPTAVMEEVLYRNA